MKLIFTEYLASLKERGELDVIMPDLLSEIGLTVISKPAVGTKQYGVDVAAVGPEPDGERTLFLISIKPGDLKRPDWDAGPQSLRTSLNQILDVYIEKHIPKRYARLPVKVVLCIGGDLHEDVRSDVNAYMDRHTQDRTSFDLWNGDRLAGLLLSGVLREKALPETWRSDLRKSVALVDEPSTCFAHFSRFVSSIALQCKPNRRARLRAIRQVYLALWTLYVWARQAENIEAAYLCSERAMLVSWPLINSSLAGKSKEARQLKQAMQRLIALHNVIADDYLITYVHPRANIPHGLASAVPSQSALDINLKLFDVLGRIGTRGLWYLQLAQFLDEPSNKEQLDTLRSAVDSTAKLIVDTVVNNPILYTPVKDSQAIDINIACLFLNRVGYDDEIRNWIQQIARAAMFAYQANDSYPCVFEDYRDLAEHPRDEPGYREEATAGTILLPTLAVWAAITGDTEILGALANFASGAFQHSTLQLWYPGPDTEEHLYLGSADHGLAATNFRIERACEDMLAVVKSECLASTAFSSLSAPRYGLWPLLASASRHHRIPLPPHLWPLDDDTPQDPQ